MAKDSGCKKIEEVFLAYANLSLKEKPQNLLKIFDVIAANLQIDLDGCDQLLSDIVKLTEYDYLCSRLYDASPGAGLSEISLNDAIYAVAGNRDSHYGRLNSSYVHECPLKDFKRSIYLDYKCDDPLRSITTKCTECHQLQFVSFLTEIAWGQKFSEIEFLKNNLWYSEVVGMQKTFIKYEEKWDGSEALKGTKKCYMGFMEFIHSDEYGNSHHSFNECLRAIALFCLTEFLLEDDRRKIKICADCGEFFVQKRLRNDQRFCCDKCRLHYNNHKRIESGEHKEYKRNKRKEGLYQ